MLTAATIFELVDLFGVFIGALTGALVARRLGYDITGLWGLALVSGLGGGVIRDILTGETPLGFRHGYSGRRATTTGHPYHST